MIQQNPEQDPSVAIEASAQPKPKRSESDKRLGKTAKGVAALATATAFFLPSPEAGNVAERDDLELLAEQDAHIDIATPTPGYERGRAEKVEEKRAEEQHFDEHEPTTYGREVSPGESVPAGSVQSPNNGNGQRNPDFDFRVATKNQGSQAGTTGPEKAADTQNPLENLMNYPVANQEVNQGDPLDGGLPGPTEEINKSEG